MWVDQNAVARGIVKADGEVIFTYRFSAGLPGLMEDLTRAWSEGSSVLTSQASSGVRRGGESAGGGRVMEGVSVKNAASTVSAASGGVGAMGAAVGVGFGAGVGRSPAGGSGIFAGSGAASGAAAPAPSPLSVLREKLKAQYEKEWQMEMEARKAGATAVADANKRISAARAELARISTLLTQTVEIATKNEETTSAARAWLEAARSVMPGTAATPATTARSRAGSGFTDIGDIAGASGVSTGSPPSALSPPRSASAALSSSPGGVAWSVGGPMVVGASELDRQLLAERAMAEAQLDLTTELAKGPLKALTDGGPRGYTVGNVLAKVRDAAESEFKARLQAKQVHEKQVELSLIAMLTEHYINAGETPEAAREEARRQQPEYRRMAMGGGGGGASGGGGADDRGAAPAYPMLGRR